MTYELSQQQHLNITYGWFIHDIVSGGPAANAGLQSGDVITGMNGTRIRNGDEMSSYLEEKTVPGQTIILRIVRGQQQVLNIQLTLGKRPPPQ